MSFIIQILRKKTLIADKNIAGKRLDIIIPFMDSSMSRSNVKKLIESNLVLVNGIVQYRANYVVKAGDIVEYEILEGREEEAIIPEDIPLEVIYEDEDLIAINKPEGMVVHPATGNWSGTVINALMYRYQTLHNVGNQIRSGLIHRIDKDTSGLLLIGKTNKGLWYYSKLFAERKVQKEYLALVGGVISKQFEQTRIENVRTYISRHTKDRKKMMVLRLDSSRLPRDARMANTYLKLLKSNNHYHLISAKPKTGRTHQIRVHLNFLGLPIIGDKVYGGQKGERLMLHAFRISLKKLDGEDIVIEAKPSNKFQKILESYNLNIFR